MTHVTCRLTAKNRDQLRNPTLGNRVWATFTVFISLNPNHNQRTNVRDGIIIRGVQVSGWGQTSGRHDSRSGRGAVCDGRSESR